MKKILSVILIFVLIFSLTACFEDTTPQKEVGDSEPLGEQAQAKQDEEFALNETAVFKDMKISISHVFSFLLAS